MLMKLHLATTAALVMALGGIGAAVTADAAGPGTSTTDCIRLSNGPYAHQRCTVTHIEDDGSVWTSVYYIDHNGQWYLPAD